jgi:DNA-binding transcriptional regulator YiaG
MRKGLIGNSRMPRISLSRDKIKLLRKALDMSQREFAQFLGVKREVVVRWEEGEIKRRMALAPQYRNAGSKIKRLRKNLDLSQKEFAARLNVERETVARWESGTRVPLRLCLIALNKLSLETIQHPLFQ